MRRWLLPLTILSYFVAVLAWVGIDRSGARSAFDEYSAANTGDDGYSLASRYLGGRLLTKGVDGTATTPRGVVVRAGKFGSGYTMLRDLLEKQHQEEGDDEEAPKPKSKKPSRIERLDLPSSLLSEGEEEFVREGGRFVLAIGGTCGPLDTRSSTEKLAFKVFPLWRGLGSIELPHPRTLSGDDALRHAHSLYTIGNSSAMSRIVIGKGDVILLAQPELFDNGHLARNLPLLLAITGKRSPVYFDETVHGLDNHEGVTDLLKAWGLGPFLLLLLVMSALLFWRYGSRLGEPDDDERDRRSDAVDLVASLGALYDRAMTDGEALDLYHQALERAVAAHSGLRGDRLHKRIEELTGRSPLSWKYETIDRETFQRRLAVINQAFRKIEHV